MTEEVVSNSQVQDQDSRGEEWSRRVVAPIIITTTITGHDDCNGVNMVVQCCYIVFVWKFLLIILLSCEDDDKLYRKIME